MVGGSQSRKWSHRGAQLCWRRGRLPCEGGHEFGAHTSHRPWEHFTEAVVFRDASTTPWSSLLPNAFLLSVRFHLRQVRWKLTTGRHWFSNTEQARVIILMEQIGFGRKFLLFAHIKIHKIELGTRNLSLVTEKPWVICNNPRRMDPIQNRLQWRIDYWGDVCSTFSFPDFMKKWLKLSPFQIWLCHLTSHASNPTSIKWR